jgi:hypothetical protein
MLPPDDTPGINQEHASTLGQRLIEKTVAIGRLRRELASVNGQIAVLRDGLPARPRVVGALIGAGLGVLLAFSIAFPSCVSNDEVARVPCPSGDVDAIVMEDNGGATTSFGYTILIAPVGSSRHRGTRVATFYGATRSERAYGVNARWVSDDVLRIEYLKAQSAGVEPPGSFTVNGRSISVSLEAGTSDPRACGGGMLHVRLNRIDCGAAGE